MMIALVVVAFGWGERGASNGGVIAISAGA